jgi:N-acetylglucosamine malate deacetylase 1
MHVLVLAPHPDDEAIGCGGTILLHSRDRGDRVACAFLTSGELGLPRLRTEQARQIREAEAEKAAEILGIARLDFLRQPDSCVEKQVQAAATALEVVLKRETPATIYLPHARDNHPDHRAALPIALRALESLRMSPPLLLGYEIWTPLSAHDRVENVTAQMPAKLAAIRTHRSQVRQCRYDRAASGLNMYRGATAGHCPFAEIFQMASNGGAPFL